MLKAYRTFRSVKMSQILILFLYVCTSRATMEWYYYYFNCYNSNTIIPPNEPRDVLWLLSIQLSL